MTLAICGRRDGDPRPLRLSFHDGDDDRRRQRGSFIEGFVWYPAGACYFYCDLCMFCCPIVCGLFGHGDGVDSYSFPVDPHFLLRGIVATNHAERAASFARIAECGLFKRRPPRRPPGDLSRVDGTRFIESAMDLAQGELWPPRQRISRLCDHDRLLALSFHLSCGADEVWQVDDWIMCALGLMWMPLFGCSAYQAATVAHSVGWTLCTLAAICNPVRARTRTKYAVRGEIIGGRRCKRRRFGSAIGRIDLCVVESYEVRGHAHCWHPVSCGCRLFKAALLIFYEFRRIGEASNPGPGADAGLEGTDGNSSCSARHNPVGLPWKKLARCDTLAYPRPHREGFRDAMAPGFSDPEPGRVSKAKCRLQLGGARSAVGWTRRQRTPSLHKRHGYYSLTLLKLPLGPGSGGGPPFGPLRVWGLAEGRAVGWRFLSARTLASESPAVDPISSPKGEQ